MTTIPNIHMKINQRKLISKSDLLKEIDGLQPGDSFYFSTDPDSNTFGITRLKIYDGDILLLGYLGGVETSLFNLINQETDGELLDWLDYCTNLNTLESLYKVEESEFNSVSSNIILQNINPKIKENIVSSLFFFMWNGWCKDECKLIFGWEFQHFWDKWGAMCRIYTVNGATEKFYAELTTNYRIKLVTHACELFDGSKRK